MLSDTLFQIVVKLKADIVHYTTGIFAGYYDNQIRNRLDKIVEELEDLRKELDTPPNSSKTN